MMVRARICSLHSHKSTRLCRLRERREDPELSALGAVGVGEVMKICYQYPFNKPD